MELDKQESSSSLQSDEQSEESQRTKIKKLKENPSLIIKDRNGKL